MPLSKQQQEAILPQPTTSDRAGQDTSSLGVFENWAEDYQTPDEMSLWDADGDHYSSRRDLSLAYQPPKSNLPGLAIALGLIVSWVSLTSSPGGRMRHGG